MSIFSFLKKNITMESKVPQESDLIEKINHLDDLVKALSAKIDEHSHLSEELKLIKQMLEELQVKSHQTEQTEPVTYRDTNVPEQDCSETEQTTSFDEKEKDSSNSTEQKTLPSIDDNSGKILEIAQLISEKIDTLNSVVNNNQSLINAAKTSDEKLNAYTSKYEGLYQNVQEDRYRKDKAKIINKMIFYVDLMRRMLYDFINKRNPDEQLSDDAIFLKNQIENLIQSMDDTLKHEMVQTRPMAQNGDTFDEETMEVIDIIETDDASLDGKIFRSISACYTWTLPYILKARINENGDEVRRYSFVIHPEEVITYKLKQQK